MRVTIWDLDYYYTKDKVNCYNTDVMRISSYHKQKGDVVNFVLTEDDIRRPYDLYYVIKEKKTTPNPPMDFFTNSKVRWWGDAVRVRINFKMDNVMLGCRPDYLLYPEKNTAQERAEYIRLFDNQANLLPIHQDYTNTFKRKDIIVVDKYMWQSSKKSLITALDMLKDVKNVSFSEPIRLDLIIDDKTIRDKILELKLTTKSRIRFTPITFDQADAAMEFILELRQKFGARIQINELIIKYDTEAHWEDKDCAYNDFTKLKSTIIRGRKLGIHITAAPLKHRIDTPFFHLFEELNRWTASKKHISWFAHLKRTHPYSEIHKPETWDDAFRDLVRQTYIDKEFFLLRWKDNYDSENDVPWKILEEEFKYGI